MTPFATTANRPAVLVHVRDYFWDIYEAVFAGVERYAVTRITDFPGRRAEAVSPEFHRRLRSGDLPPTGFDEADLVRRCRLLRNLEPARATRMLRAMHATLEPIVARQPWAAVMGQTVDDYVTHLLALLAERHGVPYLGLCSSYFPGYTQVTASWHGGIVPGRRPSEEETAAALAKVSGNRFRQDYNILVRYDRRVHVARVMRYWGKRAYFAALRHLRGAPDHVHFLLQPHLGQQKRLRDYPPPSAFHQDWADRLAASDRRAVYLPLGHTPEAGTDYMIGDRSFIAYEETIERIARTLGRTCTVLVKDHFHMLGVRDPAFHFRLQQLPGVVVVPPMVNSNALLAGRVEDVLVGAGSVGIEATIRGKRVFTFSDTAYWLAASGARHLRLGELEHWADLVAETRPVLPAPLDFVRDCLTTTLPYDYMIVQPGDAAAKGRALEEFLHCHLATRQAASLAP